MDFKSLISKIESIDGKVETPKAPELPKTVQLNEDAQLRVLAGTSTYIAEAKKKAEEKKEEKKVDEVFDADAKPGDKKTTSKGVATKTKTGLVHKSTSAYGGSEEPKDDDDDKDAPANKGGKAKKAKKESIDPDQFKSKFLKMVEAKKSDKEDKKAKKEKKMDEGAKPDFLDLDKDGNKKEPMKSAAKGKEGDSKDSGKKGMSAKQEKYFGKKNESKVQLKKVVAESVEQKLSFKDMVRLVQESGGQQQIDPIDKALFTWATRVATNKLGEGMKADLYAGLIYERNGGVFEMYDVLSESKKNISESRVRLDEGMLDKVKSFIMSKVAPKFSSEEQDQMKAAAQKVLGKDKADASDFTLDNIKAVAKALGVKKPEPATESIEEGPMDVLGKMAGDAGKKVGDFFGQKKTDPKSGMGTLGPVDAWHKDATLGEKLVSVVGSLGGTAAMIAGFFGGPGWLIIPGLLGIMFMSQVGMTKDRG